MIVSVETGPVPHLNPSDQVVVDDLECTDDVFYLTIQYGFQDKQDVPAALRNAAEQGMLGDLDIKNAIYLVSEITLVSGDDPVCARGVNGCSCCSRAHREARSTPTTYRSTGS